MVLFLLRYKMLKKVLFFIIATGLPCASAITVSTLVFRFFPSLFIPHTMTDTELGKMLALIIGPGALAVTIPFAFYRSPYWSTETVNWSGCFSMLYLGFLMIRLIGKVVGWPAVLAGIFMVVLASHTIAKRIEEGRWRRQVVGTYPEE